MDALLSVFHDRFRAQPEAVLLEGPGHHCRVSDLQAASQWVEHLLARHQVQAGACVCIRSANGPGFLALLLGVLRHSAVPILLDSQTPDAEAQRVISAMAAVGLADCRVSWPEHKDDFTFRPAPAPRESRLMAPSVIKLTSGSTGIPSGIETSLDALLADEENLTTSMGIRATDRLLAAVPMAHSYGLTTLVVTALVRGTTLLVPEAGNPFSPLQVAGDLGATVFPTTPSYLEGLVQWEGKLPPLEELRLLISAGARLRPETAQRMRRAWGRPVHAFYGASECGGIAYDREGKDAEEGLVGEPVHRVNITAIETAEHQGRGGRLSIQSSAVARGYLPRSDARLSTGRFLTDDLGVIEDGRLRLLGRLGTMVKIRGKKVDPAEVAHVLTQMPEVQDAFVHAISTEGDGPTVLEALVVPGAGSLGRKDVLGWCRQHLIPEKVPRRIVLVPDLPRTSRGKVDARQAIRRQV